MKWPRGLKECLVKLRADQVTAIFTGVIAVLTFFYVVTQTKQLYLLNQSNVGSHRAWVLIASPLAVPPKAPLHIEADKPFDITLFMENTGKSPAQRLRLINRAWVREIPLGKLPQEKELYGGPTSGPVSSGLLGPGHKASILFEKNTINQHQLDAINRGNAALYFFGRISYADQFSDDHWTRFCYYWVPGMGPGDLGVCSTYNQAK